MKKIILILLVFCLSGCATFIKKYDTLPPLGVKKIYLAEPQVYERYTCWSIFDPDKVTEEILGEHRLGIENDDAREAIEGAKAFKENLKQKLSKKFVVVENKDDADVIIKTYVSYLAPPPHAFYRRMSRHPYFRGDVAVVCEVEYGNGKKIAKMVSGSQYTDKKALILPYTLQQALVGIISERLTPKIEEVLGG